MKKITLTIILFWVTHLSFSQCINSIESQDSPAISDNSGDPQQLTTLLFTDEYFTLSGIITGDEYEFSVTHSGDVHEYITITDETNVPLMDGGSSLIGYSPLTTSAIAVNTIRVHIRADDICSPDTFANTFVIKNISKAICNKPLTAPGDGEFTYLSDTRIDWTWTAPELTTPESYNWEIGPSGFTPGTGNEVASGMTPDATPSASSGQTLTAGTQYDIFIRSNCGIDGLSDWADKIPFSTLSSPPPVNDFCEGATYLLQETNVMDAASATPIASTLEGGAGTNQPAENCDGNANARDDVWYSFIAQTTDVTITLEPQFNGILTLFSGTCNSLTQLACSDVGNDGVNEEISYNSFMIGQTYYFRIYSQGFKAINPTFDLKLWTASTIIDNDNDGYASAVDCNDVASSCTTDCDTDTDNDGIPDCEDLCIDSDGDDYGTDNSGNIVGLGTVAVGACTTDGTTGCSFSDASCIATDCDDSDSEINPAASEICDGIDNDCDGLTDDADDSVSDQSTWYADTDGDGYGDLASPLIACFQPTDYVLDNLDCDDTDTNINPDTVWYADSDGDGYGDINNTLTQCLQPTGYVANNTDCDDSEVNNYPGNTEVCDGIDNDCDGMIDEEDDALRSTANLPTTSPYADGLTCAASVFNVTGNDAIIDWVWVEVRDSADGITVIASTSALLQSDGEVVDTDGVSLLDVDVLYGNYYLMLSHRNHLGVLTASTVSLSGGVMSLDLTNNSALVEGGTNGIADMGDGSFALYAGDFNGDGQVQNTDKNAVEPLRGISGYENADIDMNSEVQNSDINSVLNPNIGRGEQSASRNLNLNARRRTMQQN
jgi:hypothetical protein